MNGPSFSNPVNHSCADVLLLLRQSLRRLGLRALETFDLQTARSEALDCTCPHHGSAECDCQMVVLMVYGEGTAPTTLMLHGSDGKTWISLPDDPGDGPDPLIGRAVEETVQCIRTG